MNADNQYILGLPIEIPEHFYGRREQVNRFFSRIKKDQPSPLQLIGARRSGKTSFLYHVSNRDIASQKLESTTTEIKIIYVNTLEGSKDPAAFHKIVIKAVLKTLPSAKQPSNDAVVTSEGFNDWLRSEGADYRLVILLDEFDRIAYSEAFDFDFFSNLRSLVCKNLLWVTSSFRDLYRLSQNRGPEYFISPFYNVFDPEPIVMGRLEPAEATRLIKESAERSGIFLREEEVYSIRQIAGDFPYYIQVSADKWLQIRNEDLHEDECKEKVLSLLLRLMPGYFESSWRNLNFHERQCLQRAAKGQTLSNNKTDFEAIYSLQRLELLAKYEGELRPAGELFRRWIDTSADSSPGVPRVFIGHGRNRSWKDVERFIEKNLNLIPVSYQTTSRVGIQIVSILQEMLEQADYALLLLTKEDETKAGRYRARQNVVHEAGLMQGKLGFDRVVLLKQKGVEGFSNLAGMQVIEFGGDKIESSFEEIRDYFQGQGVVP